MDKWYDAVEDEQESLSAADAVKESVYQRTWESIQQSPKVIPLYKKPVFRFSIAAVLLLGMAGIWFVFTPDGPSKPSLADNKNLPKSDIAPPPQTPGQYWN